MQTDLIKGVFIGIIAPIILFVFVTVFLPTGIVGFIKEKKLNRFFLLTKS